MLLHSLVRSRMQLGIRRAGALARGARGFATRAELHAMALAQNSKHKEKLAEDFRGEVDLAMVSLPRDIKFNFRDTVEEREWKRRQQTYYYMEENYGYIEEALAKEGLVSAEELAAKQEFIQKRIASRHSLLDEVRTPRVSLADLKTLEEQYDVPAALRLADSDSPADKKRKVQEQVAHFVKSSRDALAEMPSTHAKVRAMLKEAEDAYRVEEDVELFLMENEEKLKSDFVWDDDKLAEFSRKVRKVAVEAFGKVKVENWTKSEPLDRLGLIPRGKLDTIEAELRQAQAVAEKRSAEFELRFGSLPDMSQDPYMLEFNEQLAFHQKKEVETFGAKQMALAAAADAKANAEGEVAAEAEAEGEGEEAEEYWDFSASSSEEEMPPNFQPEYAQQRTQRTFLSAEGEDGEQWPKIVDGLELEKFNHLRDVDYQEFEDPPTEFETRLLDAFAYQRQLRAAKDSDTTLVPRVHVPNTPDDDSLVAKALLLYRMQAIRRHIFQLKERRKKEYERAYRDIGALNLTVPYDPSNPWKQDMFEEVQLVLKNQGSWTTGQKERFLVKLHKALTDDTFSQKNFDFCQF